MWPKGRTRTLANGTPGRLHSRAGRASPPIGTEATFPAPTRQDLHLAICRADGHVAAPEATRTQEQKFNPSHVSTAVQIGHAADGSWLRPVYAS